MQNDNGKIHNFVIFTDEEEQLQPITLTRQHKGAIRAIRKVRTGKLLPYFLSQLCKK